MVEEIDVWRSANLYVGQFGDQAVLEAGMKADEMLERGDMDGVAFWRRVIKAINKLQNSKLDGTIH